MNICNYYKREERKTVKLCYWYCTPILECDAMAYLRGIMGLLFMFIILPGQSQDLRADLLAFSNILKNSPNLSFEIHVDVYRNMDDKTPDLTKRGHVAQNGSRFLLSFDNITMLLGDKFYVYVDENDKNIYVKETNAGKNTQSREKLKNDFRPEKMVQAMDSSIKHCDEIQFGGIRNGDKLYYLKSRKGIINTTELYLSATSGLLSKVVYYYNKTIMKQNNKVDIIYDHFTTTPVFTTTTFSEAPYVTQQNGKTILTGKYKNYTVIPDVPDNYLE